MKKKDVKVRRFLRHIIAVGHVICEHHVGISMFSSSYFLEIYRFAVIET